MARLSLDSLVKNPATCLPIGDEDFTRLKAQHGSSLWTTPLRGCPTCGDDRWFRARKSSKIVEYDCDCEQQWILYLWLLNAGIGLSYQRIGLYDITAVKDSVLRQIYEYLDPTSLSYNLRLGQGMMLWSAQRGTGKTMLSIMALKKVLELGYDGYFTTFSDMLDMYQSTWRDADQRKWFDRKVRNVSFLVIDDIGKEGQTRSRSVTESMIDAVIRARNAAALPTIITTNFSPAEVDQGYSVASLLSASVTPIEVAGEDYRITFAEQGKRDVHDRVSRPLVML
jgi:DNA replication protein DnaC